MQSDQKPRLEPRLVFLALMLAIPVLYLVAQTVVFRPGDPCEDHAAGGLGQMFVPGVGCEPEPVVPRTGDR